MHQREEVHAAFAIPKSPYVCPVERCAFPYWSPFTICRGKVGWRYALEHEPARVTRRWEKSW